MLPARPVKVLKTLKPFPVKFGKVLGGARFAGQSLLLEYQQLGLYT